MACPRLPRKRQADIASPPLQGIRARSSAGEHYLDMVGVTGSIPVAPTSLRPAITCVTSGRRFVLVALRRQCDDFACDTLENLAIRLVQIAVARHPLRHLLQIGDRGCRL